jgi:valyl-tRNA synthetase
MLAEYPEPDSTLEFASDAEDYELGLQCAGGFRSLAADYNIRSDGCAFIKASTAASLDKVSAQLQTIKTLSGKGISEVTILGPDADEASAPKGCAVYVVSADVAVLLQVSTKLQKTDIVIKKQQELMGREGFEKVSDVVLTAEKKKLADAEAAKENYERTLAEFSKLKL